MISVIIPVYNVEPYLARCLDSVIAQSERDIEIIIIDDGSTDGCDVICDEYAKKDERIRVIHQENQGLSAARNRGIDAARGEYISFVDSDDYLLTDMLEKLLDACKEYDADMSICAHLNIKEGIRNADKLIQQARSIAPEKPVVCEGQEIMTAYLKHHLIPVTAWGKIYRARLFQETYFPVGRYYEDSQTTYKLLHASKRAVILNRPGYIYYKRPNSITTSDYISKHRDVVCGKIDQFKFIQAHYPHLMPYMEANLISACNTLMCKLASSNAHDRDMEAMLQKLFRQYGKSYLKYYHSWKGKIIVSLACIHLKLAILALFIYYRIFE